MNTINLHEIKKVETKKKEIAKIQYISMYSMSMFVISSKGKAPESQGSCLGVYLESGVHDGFTFFEQLHTVEGTEGKCAFKDDDGGWSISPS